MTPDIDNRVMSTGYSKRGADFPIHQRLDSVAPISITARSATENCGVMMQNTVEVPISEDKLTEVSCGHALEQRKLRILELFDGLIDDNKEELLRGFCTNQRETFQGDVSVSSVSFTDDRSGWGCVTFSGYSFHGCKDLEIPYNHTKDVAFVVDLAREKIMFTTDTPEDSDRSDE